MACGSSPRHAQGEACRWLRLEEPRWGLSGEGRRPGPSATWPDVKEAREIKPLAAWPALVSEGPHSSQSGSRTLMCREARPCAPAVSPCSGCGTV